MQTLQWLTSLEVTGNDLGFASAAAAVPPTTASHLALTPTVGQLRLGELPKQ